MERVCAAHAIVRVRLGNFEAVKLAVTLEEFALGFNRARIPLLLGADAKVKRYPLGPDLHTPAASARHRHLPLRISCGSAESASTSLRTVRGCGCATRFAS